MLKISKIEKKDNFNDFLSLRYNPFGISHFRLKKKKTSKIFIYKKTSEFSVPKFKKFD